MSAPGDDYKGRYIYQPTGEVFALRIVPREQVRQERTHHAKSDRAFWDGTKEAFEKQFREI